MLAHEVMLLVLLSAAVCANGFSFVPMQDATLHDSADVILVVSGSSNRSTFCDSSFESGVTRPMTRCTVVVDRVLKPLRIAAKDVLGEIVAGTVLTVAVPGGVDHAAGLRLHVYGTPEVNEVLISGSRILLFADVLRTQSANFGATAAGPLFGVTSPLVLVPCQHALGFFREVVLPAHKDRSVASFAVCDAADHKFGEWRRDFELFAGWLAARSVDHHLRPAERSEPKPAAQAEYWRKYDVSEIVRRWQIFSDPFRWCAFDSGSVSWRSHADGQPGQQDGAVPEFQRALDAFTSTPSIQAQAIYGGTTRRKSGLVKPDGTNALIYDDPNGEIAGSFSCTSGGTLAIGGAFVSTTRSCAFGAISPVPFEIVEGDIVMQDGIDCLSLIQLEEVYTHELGHAHGMAHSLDTSATMYAEARFDGRGSTWDDDDIAGLEYLYCKIPSTYPVCVECTLAICNSSECGDKSDLCGGVKSCGGCASGQICNQNLCVACIPESCSPSECGTTKTNVCGNVTTCSCNPGEICDGGSCAACTLEVCSPDECGTKTNVCGNVTSCLTCNSGEVCSGGTCIVCTPEICSPGDCGIQTNACGNVTVCDPCGSGSVCVGGTCVACALPVCNASECGLKTNVCGNQTQCLCGLDETCSNITGGTCVCNAVPQTECSKYACGSRENACGSVVLCGTCAAGEQCRTTNSSSTCFCPSITCPPNACGNFSNSCGSVNCGSCGPGEECTVNNTCACPPVLEDECISRTVGGFISVCGSIFNACGEIRNCTCPLDSTCNSTSGNGFCACNPVDCGEFQCGNYSNSCSSSNCGTCNAGKECSSSNMCVCLPVPEEECLSRAISGYIGVCGSISNACGKARNCTCPLDSSCNSTSGIGLCSCNPVECGGVQCGNRTNTCGGNISCGPDCVEVDASSDTWLFQEATAIGMDLEWIWIFCIAGAIVLICCTVIIVIIKRKLSGRSNEDLYWMQDYDDYGGKYKSPYNNYDNNKGDRYGKY